MYVWICIYMYVNIYIYKYIYNMDFLVFPEHGLESDLERTIRRSFSNSQFMENKD